jgi:aminoglycoside 6'-N-acetyltransferase I
MSAKIRAATPADLADIQRLNAELFKYEDSLDVFDHSRNLDWSYSDAGLQNFRRCIAGQDGLVAFVAAQDGRVTGYLTASLYSKTWMATNPIAEINNLYVDPKYRRHGAGSGLMTAFKDWARGQRAQRLRVEGLTANHPAMAFYAYHGFKNVETVLEQPGEES